VPETTMTAGKMVNPYYTVEKSYLIYDGDFRPEGVAIGWTDKTFFANLTYTYIESDSTAPAADGESDYGIPAVQVGVNLVPFTDTTLTLAAGYINVPTEGHPAIYNGKFQGNSSVKDGDVAVYEYDYHVANASAAFGFRAFDLPFSVYGDYIQNQDADNLDTGYMVGVRLGTAKIKGQWQVAYQYEALDANATLGEMTDSDFGGGGTDVKGNVVSGQYMLTDNWYVGSTLFFDQNQGVDLGSNLSYNRLQVDTGLKY
jgi:Putative porin